MFRSVSSVILPVISQSLHLNSIRSFLILPDLVTRVRRSGVVSATFILFFSFNVLSPPTQHSDLYIIAGPLDSFIKLRLFYRTTNLSSLLGHV